jgi:transposase-like protein
MHRMLKAGVVELPGPLPGPPSIRAAVKAGHHILHRQAIDTFINTSRVPDTLRSYAAANAEVMLSVEHQQQNRLNNRAENSHQPTRERERRMRGFKSSGRAQRFLSIFGVIASFFRPGRHLLLAKSYREIMHRRFTQWREIVGLQPAI